MRTGSALEAIQPTRGGTEKTAEFVCSQVVPGGAPRELDGEAGRERAGEVGERARNSR